MSFGSRGFRVAISQRYLPHYRVAVMNEVNSALLDLGGELRFFYNLTMGEFEEPGWAVRLPGWRFQMKIGDDGEAAVATVSPLLFWKLLRYSPDCLVLEDVSGLPNTLLAALYAAVFRRPYLIWGLGRVPMTPPSLPRRVLAPLIRLLHRRAAGFICYSRSAEQEYSGAGRPTFLAPNSSLPRPNAEEVAEVRDAISRRAGGERLRIVSIGVLKKQKRFDVLLEAVAGLSSPFELHLVGAGPEEASLREQALRLGIESQVIFHGALYDAKQKRKIFLNSDLGVLPGRGGLAIQEMLAHGLPVICGVADGTEQDLIVEEINGYRVAGLPSAKELADRIARFRALESHAREMMSLRAIDVVLQKFNAQKMAAGMTSAILHASGRGSDLNMRITKIQNMSGKA